MISMSTWTQLRDYFLIQFIHIMTEKRGSFNIVTQMFYSLKKMKWQAPNNYCKTVFIFLNVIGQSKQGYDGCTEIVNSFFEVYPLTNNVKVSQRFTDCDPFFFLSLDFLFQGQKASNRRCLLFRLSAKRAVP